MNEEELPKKTYKASTGKNEKIGKTAKLAQKRTVSTKNTVAKNRGAIGSEQGGLRVIGKGGNYNIRRVDRVGDSVVSGEGGEGGDDEEVGVEEVIDDISASDSDSKGDVDYTKIRLISNAGKDTNTFVNVLSTEYEKRKEQRGHYGFEGAVEGKMEHGADKTVHMADIDSEDEGIKMSEIYQGDADLDKEIDQKKLAKDSQAYMKVAARIKEIHPRANVVPGRAIPTAGFGHMATKIEIIDDVPMKRNKSGLIVQNKDSLLCQQMKNQRQMLESKKQEKEYIMRRFKPHVNDLIYYTNNASRAFMRNQDSVHEMTKNFIEKRPKVSEKRDIMSSHFYLPKNCTGKSVQAILSSVENEEAKVRYNCPIVSVILALAKSMNFANIEDFEEDIKKGDIAKNLKDIKRLVASEDFGGRGENPFSLASRNYLENVDNYNAKLQFDQEEDFGDIFDLPMGIEGINNDAVQERELRLFSDIERHSKSTYIYAPFKYSVRYTYKLLYYHYLNMMSFILPFGKTCPDSTWLMIFSLHIDPENILGTRLESDAYGLKVGGVGLLEKTIFASKSEVVEFKKIYQPILSKSVGKDYGNDIVGGFILNTMKISMIQTKLSEINDELHEIYAKASDEFQNVKTIFGRGEFKDKELKMKMNALENTKNRILSIETRRMDRKELMDMISIPYDTSRIRLKSVLVPISFQIVSFAAEIDSLRKKAKSKVFDCDQWLIQMIEDAIVNRVGVMAIFLEMYRDPNYSGVMAYLFGNSKNARKCIAFVGSIHEQIEKGELSSKKIDSRYTGMISNMSTSLVYCRVTAKIKRESNPKLMDFVLRSIQNPGGENKNINPFDAELQDMSNIESFNKDIGVIDNELKPLSNNILPAENDTSEQYKDLAQRVHLFNYRAQADENQLDQHMLYKFCLLDKNIRKGFVDRTREYIGKSTYKQADIVKDMMYSMCSEFSKVCDRKSRNQLEKLYRNVHTQSGHSMMSILDTFRKINQLLKEKQTDTSLSNSTRNLAAWTVLFMNGIYDAINKLL
jgi:hypothetical protein